MDWTTCTRKLLDNGQDRGMPSPTSEFRGRRWGAVFGVGAPGLLDVTATQAKQPKEQPLLLPSSSYGPVELSTFTFGACGAGARRV
jgi:hypothetical protein